MKLLLKNLQGFLPDLEGTADQTAAQLTDLGFEAVVESKEVLDISLTPNRGDAMSALGLARDLAAYLNRDTVSRSLPALASTKLIDRLPNLETPKLTFEALDAVISYDAVVFEGIRVQPSPKWLAEAVTKLGWRSINSIVDLTNYLMDLYGQPLHAFDLDAILGQQLTIRASLAGEKLQTLDGSQHELPANLLVIQDRDSLIDLVGIMGGANSQIHPRTTRVLMQAASFDPTIIRRATNALGVRTQAAIRYERGTDPALARPVLNEAIRILKKVDMGRAKAVGQLQSNIKQSKRRSITVDPAQVNHLLGMTVPPARQAQLLTVVGCLVTVAGDELKVTAPSWRHDLTIWQDCAEEIARLSGLGDRLPATKLPAMQRSAERSTIEWSEALKDRLIELGLSEVLTYSFTSKQLLDSFELPIVGELANPLNPTLRYLRPSLVPNLAQIVAANQSFDPILIFEIGHVFTLSHEEERLAIGIIGQSEPTSAWLARLADQIGIDSAALLARATVVELTESQRSTLKIRKNRASFIELRLADLSGARKIPQTYELLDSMTRYRKISRFPAITRDAAFLVPAAQDAQAMAELASRYDGWIESVDLFDEFQSEKLGLNKKSIAFHIRYADLDRTLTEAEVTAVHERLVASIEQTFDATIR